MSGPLKGPMNVLAPSFAASLLISLAGTASGQEPLTAVPGEVPTWSAEIASLIHGKCAECHRPGEAAPFSLLSYRDVQKRGPMVLDVVEDRYMPPWHPERGHGTYQDARRLNEAEIDMLRRWVEGGMPRGDASKEPQPPEFSSDWMLGPPDLIVEMPEAFPVPAGGPDIYRNFAIPLDLPEDRWVTAIAVRPGDRTVLHHVLMFADDTGSAVEADRRDRRPGFSGMRRVGRSIGGWAVGGMPRHLPNDLAISLPKGSDLVLQSHFHPSGKKTEERTKIGFYFKEKPPERTFQTVMVPPVYGALWGLDVPAGQSDFVMRDRFTAPADMELVTVGGHAHMLCKSMRAVATLPSGEQKVIFHIPAWDFDWQTRYEYRDAVQIPKGTVVEVEIVYDNSARNPSNPHDPPQRVRWGRESTDEMGAVIFGAVALDEKDSPSLKRGIRDEMQRSMRRARSRVSDGLVDRLMASDRDGDGALTREETPRMFRRQFDRADADKDGKVTREELQKAVARRRR